MMDFILKISKKEISLITDMGQHLFLERLRGVFFPLESYPGYQSD